jgi:PHS family inorganic phosphate transporter-like MFS transporter
MLTGVFSTLLLPETKGRSLEDLSNEDQTYFVGGSGGSHARNHSEDTEVVAKEN